MLNPSPKCLTRATPRAVFKAQIYLETLLSKHYSLTDDRMLLYVGWKMEFLLQLSQLSYTSAQKHFNWTAVSCYLGDVTLADFLKGVELQARSLRAQRRQQKTQALAGRGAGRAADGTLGCASAPRHQWEGAAAHSARCPHSGKMRGQRAAASAAVH